MLNEKHVRQPNLTPRHVSSYRHGLPPGTKIPLKRYLAVWYDYFSNIKLHVLLTGMANVPN